MGQKDQIVLWCQCGSLALALAPDTRSAEKGCFPSYIRSQTVVWKQQGQCLSFAQPF